MRILIISIIIVIILIMTHDQRHHFIMIVQTHFIMFYILAQKSTQLSRELKRATSLFVLLLGMATMRIAVSLLVVRIACVQSRAWPPSSSSYSDTVPNVEVSLEPPAKPYPQIAQQIGNLESSREHSQEVYMHDLQTSFTAAMKHQQSSIGDIVGRAMRAFSNPVTLAREQRHDDASSFVALDNNPLSDAETLSMKINVLAQHAAPDVAEHVNNLEHTRGDMARSAVDKAKLDIHSTGDFFQREFENQIQLQVNACVGIAKASLSKRAKVFRGFTRLPKQVNVRVVASDIPYPTVSSMVQDMETRRDISERLLGLKALNMQLELLKIGNEMAKDTLTRAINRVMA
jgi:hypothetical protein